MSSIQKAYDIAQKRYDATEHPHFYAQDDEEVQCDTCDLFFYKSEISENGLCPECEKKFDFIMNGKV